VQLVDIGIGPYLPEPTVRVLSPAEVAELLSAAVPGPDDHKYTRGVVGVAAGSAQYTGAGLLAVAGASCGVAGMVRYDGAAEVADLVRMQHPEVVLGAGQVQCWVVGSGGGGDAAAFWTAPAATACRWSLTPTRCSRSPDHSGCRPC
jgi:NAD(P)H-hydrate repair Nnr-like enzyme with NAD(P)H-hydrate dehydratase domain